jgi:hypothetical protein
MVSLYIYIVREGIEGMIRSFYFASGGFRNFTEEIEGGFNANIQNVPLILFAK